MALVAHAQYRASIQGVVSDPTGAVVPGANVTLTDTATNQKLTTVTSSGGVYTFNALPPSVFTLAVDKAGFKKKALSDVHIVPEQANALNVQLELGDASQTVTVDASNSTLLETQTASVSGTISSQPDTTHAIIRARRLSARATHAWRLRRWLTGRRRRHE